MCFLETKCKKNMVRQKFKYTFNEQYYKKRCDQVQEVYD